MCHNLRLDETFKVFKVRSYNISFKTKQGRGAPVRLGPSNELHQLDRAAFNFYPVLKVVIGCIHFLSRGTKSGKASIKKNVILIEGKLAKF